MRSPAFLGAAYISRAPTLANSEAINLYPEINETREGKAIGGFYTTPGLTLLSNAGAGPIRGSLLMAGVLYVVSGSNLYSVDGNWNATLLGSVTFTSSPVSMITNGAQLAIFDGAQGFVYAPPAPLTSIALPFSGPLSATYQDGFGLVNQVGTRAWWQSNLLDLRTWGPLNFSTADAQPDNIIALKSLKRECWLIKEHDAEIWVNAGNPGFSFQRLEGVFLESGILAPYSLVKCGEAPGASRLAWLSKNEDGAGVVVATNGYQLERISTHYIERRIQSFTNASSAVAYSYQDEGHLFYVINFTADNETWAYDFTASAGLRQPCWHRRAAFANGLWNRHWGNNHTFAYGRHVIGDFQSGNLYAYDLNQPLDNGAQRRWLRSWRALGEPQENPTRFDRLRIDMQTGLGVPVGSNPQCTLRWSDDGGAHYPVSRIGAVGQVGETARRVQFMRLGSTKRFAGLDRLFELSSSDVFGVGLIGAEIE